MFPEHRAAIASGLSDARARASIRGMNFHTVAAGAGILAVECKDCGRRTCLTKEDGLPIFRGNMDLVRDVKASSNAGSAARRRYAPTRRSRKTMR